MAILGGSGFVGQEMCRVGLRKGYEVTAISRRGMPPKMAKDLEYKPINWVSADCAEYDELKAVLSENGPFDAYVHTIGLLFDVDSGFSQYNSFVSGSSSTPSTASTYDRITRQTAFNLIDFIEEEDRKEKEKPPFLFVSAAEAGWTLETPVGWLERYLIAKRKVEKRLMESSAVRDVILRPSLIWSMEQPQALPSVCAFYIGNAVGLRFVDKPVRLETLCRAGYTAMASREERGVLRYMDMERLSKNAPSYPSAK